MTDGEKEVFENIPSDYNKFYIPMIWATSLVVRARKENRIRDDFALKTMLDVGLYVKFDSSLYWIKTSSGLVI
jgi:hypothetical protein